MATNLKVEGDLSQISEAQLEYIQSVIEELGYKDNRVSIEPIGEAGDNYIANVKKIIIDDVNGGTFKMVAKIAPRHEMMRKMANTELLFRNEHVMYTKVLANFTQLEVAANIPDEEKFRYATCYGSSSDAPNEVILLEDLNASNFTMLDRFQPLSHDSVKSVLKSFAKLHSLSYVQKHEKPELFDVIKNSLFDMWGQMDQNESVMAHLKQMERNAYRIVDNDMYKNAIDGALIGALKDASKMAQYDKDSKYSIIQQGDSWNNNIMFKFNGEMLLESVMIDYQLSKATSPASDILYMIFNCTDHKMRKEHYYNWIDYYHNELDKSLSNYGLEAKFVFPKDQLDADLKRYGKINFGLSILLASILSLKSEEAASMKEGIDEADSNKIMAGLKAGTKDPETFAIIKRRLEDLVDSCLEFELI